MKTLEKEINDLIKSNNSYPFLDWNTNIKDYILLNLFWVNFINQFDLKDWNYSTDYYVNFDNENDRDFSTDVIYIKNTKFSKKIAISPITNYEKKFDLPSYSIGIFKQEDDTESNKEYDIISIEIDISNDKNIKITANFMEYFLSEKYEFETMEKMIEDYQLSLS